MHRSRLPKPAFTQAIQAPAPAMVQGNFALDKRLGMIIALSLT
jgi:hypothetical protein